MIVGASVGVFEYICARTMRQHNSQRIPRSFPGSGAGLCSAPAGGPSSSDAGAGTRECGCLHRRTVVDHEAS
jgi:hypothetical protein